MKRLTICLVLVCTACLIAACSTPAPNETPEQKQARILKDVKHTVSDAKDGVDVLVSAEPLIFQAGQFSQDDQNAIKIGIADVQNTVTQLNAQVQTYTSFDAKSKDDIVRGLNSIITLIDNLNKSGTLHIKNERSQAIFTASVGLARLAVSQAVKRIPDAS